MNDETLLLISDSKFWYPIGISVSDATQVQRERFVSPTVQECTRWKVFCADYAFYVSLFTF